MTAVLLRVRGLRKSFPGVRALRDVDLDVAHGSCHALVGENGAGKSTLGKILAGIHVADRGEIEMEGRRLALRSPLDAARAGIGMVHQELLFCENLSVAENLCLADPPGGGGFVRRREMDRRARGRLRQINATVDPAATVGDLSIAQRQLVQIAAAVARGARVLIFDEPTSSLSQAEVENLFRLMARLRQSGVTLIYVSHRMEEIYRTCDTITVLRDGEVVATRSASECGPDELVRLMIGRPLDAYFPGHLSREPGEELLRIEDLSLPPYFDGISLCVRAGEVLGLAGLVGAGRTELLETVFGLRRPAAGKISVRGRETIRTPRAAMAAGLGLVPEDRKRHGLVLSMTARENVTLPVLERLARWGGGIRAARERSLASRYCDRLRVRAAGLDAGAGGLSGGNQQKLVIARWMAAECPVLLMDEPTRGVDVGAKAEIHGLIDELANQGAAVLLVSSELPELMNLCTRILVMRRGRLVARLARREATPERLLRLMAGVEERPPADAVRPRDAASPRRS